MSVSGLKSWLFREGSDLEEVIGQLSSCTAYAFLRGLSERQIRCPAVRAIPSDQKRQRGAIWHGMSRMPVITLVALMLDPQITWL